MSRNPLVPSLGKHAATGQARVLIRGRHVYLGRHGSPEAEEKYHRLVAELLAGSPAPGHSVPSPGSAAPPAMTVNELVLAYWRHAERYYRKNGQPTSELSVLKMPPRVLRRLYRSMDGGGATGAADHVERFTRVVSGRTETHPRNDNRRKIVRGVCHSPRMNTVKTCGVSPGRNVSSGSSAPEAPTVTRMIKSLACAPPAGKSKDR